MKYPVGGELFAHLAAAGFFNEEVLCCEMPRNCFALCVPFDLVYALFGVLSWLLSQVTRFYIGSMVRTRSLPPPPATYVPIYSRFACRFFFWNVFTLRAMFSGILSPNLF
jgi:hypothetical protein